MTNFKMRRDVFQAIADPKRRAIIGILALRRLTLNQVSEQFDISRTAVTKHIKILCECGLIMINKQGREKYCEVKLDKLKEVSTWVDHYRKIWETRFDALDDLLKELDAANNKPLTKSIRDTPLNPLSRGEI